MAERSPCPYCGSGKLRPEVRTTDVPGRNVRKVTVCIRCSRCFARGGTASGEIPDPLFGEPKSDRFSTLPELMAKAEEKWNWRAT